MLGRDRLLPVALLIVAQRVRGFGVVVVTEDGDAAGVNTDERRGGLGAVAVVAR